MLQHLGPGDIAFLVDVPDDEGGEAVRLGPAHDGHRTLAHLADAPGRGGQLRVEHRLYGVDDDHSRLRGVNGCADLAQVRLRQHVYLPVRDAQALRTHLQLTAALFAGDIEYLLAPADQAAELQQQRALAHARRAAHEHHAPAHGPAAEDAVELRKPGGKAYLLLRVQLGEQLGRRTALSGPRGVGLSLGLGRGLHKRVPGPAGRALPGPFCRFIPAFRAVKHGFFLHVTVTSSMLQYSRKAASSAAAIAVR